MDPSARTQVVRRTLVLCATWLLIAGGAPAYASNAPAPRGETAPAPRGETTAASSASRTVPTPSAAETSVDVDAPANRVENVPGLPSPAIIRACMASISRVAGCLGSTAYAVCGVSFSKFLSCSRKAYNAYETTIKVQDFRASPSCPSVLADMLAEYLCTYRVPPAPRSVWAVVDNAGYNLTTHTGPSTDYPSPGVYRSGTRLPVVCVAAFGELMTFAGTSSMRWSRLTNGLFVPWVALRPETSETVPWC
ncbi:exported hypothetical protein [metagenome]|uniref:Uncharacterized protein n=1 Tax=metagenome TaxID=256318 RepID=A0A2P2C9R4_9ZZZZ